MKPFSNNSCGAVALRHDDYLRKTAARRTEVGGLALIKAGAQPLRFALVNEMAQVHFQLDGMVGDVQQALAGLNQVLRDIVAVHNFREYPPG